MSTKSLVKSSEMFSTGFEALFKPWNEWFGNGGLWGRIMNVPSVNVAEGKDNYMVSLAAPGMKKMISKLISKGICFLSVVKKEHQKKKRKKTILVKSIVILHLAAVLLCLRM